MPFFQKDDRVQIYYEVVGTGKPLMLVHGFMGTGATEFPALREALAEQYQVITPDLRGYGQSEPKPRAYEVDFYRHDAEDLAALIEHLALNAVAIVGYSDGGEVALWMPLLLPEQVKTVVTWGATGHFDTSIKGAILENLQMPWRTPQIDQLHGAEYIQQMAQGWVHAMLGMIERGGDITFSRAGEITCPVLMMLGDRDTLNPIARGRAMTEAISKGQFMAFKNTGHPIHTEKPQKFRRAMMRFLKKSLY